MTRTQVEPLSGPHLLAVVPGAVVVVISRAGSDLGAAVAVWQQLRELIAAAADVDGERYGRAFARLATRWAVDVDDDVEFGVLASVDNGVSAFLHGAVSVAVDDAPIIHGSEAAFTVDRIIRTPRVVRIFAEDTLPAGPERLATPGIENIERGVLRAGGAAVWFGSQSPDADSMGPGRPESSRSGAGVVTSGPPADGRPLDNGTPGRQPGGQHDEAAADPERGNKLFGLFSKKAQHLPAAAADVQRRAAADLDGTAAMEALPEPDEDAAAGPDIPAGSASAGWGAFAGSAPAGSGASAGSAPAGSGASAGSAPGDRAVRDSDPGQYGETVTGPRSADAISPVPEMYHQFADADADVPHRAPLPVDPVAASSRGSLKPVVVPELEHAETAVSAVVASSAGPAEQVSRVRGVHCARGHLNDPRVSFCRLCGLRMSETKILSSGERPPMGVLVLDDGSQFVLRSNVVIGREPKTSDAAAAGAAPWRVPDVSGGLSRAHVEVQLVDWDVTLVDRGSTNGTHVRFPDDADWRRLSPHTPLVLAPGAMVSIGGRTFTFDSPHAHIH